jgi:hypothetical protein
VTVHREIADLLQRYARAVDRRAVDELVGLFHPEAEIAGARGEQSLEEWLATMRAPRAFPVSMHVIGDPLVDHREGTEEAGADTYAVVYQLGDPGAGQADLTLGMHYVDLLVRHQRHWVFRHRTASVVWMR